MSRPGRHIGYVLKRFPRISETFIAAELIELERQGERVTVFAVSRPEEAFTHGFLRELKAPVIYLPHRPLREPVRVTRALLEVMADTPVGWLRAAAVSMRSPSSAGLRHLLQATVLRSEAARAGIGHVHAHFATTAARLANLSWRMGGPTYSVATHAKDIYHRQVRVRRLLDKLSNATFVSTVSSSGREHLRSMTAGRARLHVVPNAVDIRRLERVGPRSPEHGLILSVARLVEKKGLADLIEACGILDRRGIAFRLEIAGDGPLRGALEDSARRAGIPAVFHGSIPNEDVLDMCRRAAVFCLPCVVASTGDRDGLPTSVLEAMALGVPVVTTAVSGLGELVVDEETGLVVPERAPLALAQALERVLTEPSLAARLSANGRRRVEEGFSLETSVTRLRGLLPGAV